MQQTGAFISNTFSEGKRTLSEQAYLTIREAILTMRLEPGQAIFESELAGMLQMSRTPIREAVRTLLVEELIDVLPQRGMKVSLISERRVEDRRYVRELLEVGSIRRLVQSWDSGQLKYQRMMRDLEANLEVQREAQKNRDFEEFLRADEIFHRFFMQAVENSTLISIVAQMRSHLNRIRSLTLRELKNSDSLTREHEDLLVAIQAKDESRAVAVLTNHLRRLSVDISFVKERYPAYFATD